jgi:hypothetical protein
MWIWLYVVLISQESSDLLFVAGSRSLKRITPFFIETSAVGGGNDLIEAQPPEFPLRESL